MGGGGGAAGRGGSTSSDGGSARAKAVHPMRSAGGWVSILPTDANLTGWIPADQAVCGGDWTRSRPSVTTRQTGYLVVSYADYPSGSFANHFGLLYYDKVLTNYKVRIEYRFQNPQATDPATWGKNNSGLMVFCTDPRTVTGNPDFPPSIEIQLLGNPSAGGYGQLSDSA